MSEDGRDNTAHAPAQAAGGRGAVADAADDAVENTAKDRCTIHRGGGLPPPARSSESRTPSVPIPLLRTLPAQ